MAIFAESFLSQLATDKPTVFKAAPRQAGTTERADDNSVAGKWPQKAIKRMADNGATVLSS
jgi:hypothetical protein